MRANLKMVPEPTGFAFPRQFRRTPLRRMSTCRYDRHLCRFFASHSDREKQHVFVNRGTFILSRNIEGSLPIKLLKLAGPLKKSGAVGADAATRGTLVPRHGCCIYQRSNSSMTAIIYHLSHALVCATFEAKISQGIDFGQMLFPSPNVHLTSLWCKASKLLTEDISIAASRSGSGRLFPSGWELWPKVGDGVMR
jgi:hypothetical protein